MRNAWAGLPAMLLLAGCAPLEMPEETGVAEPGQVRLWQEHRRSVAGLDEWGMRGRFGLQWADGQVQGRLEWRQAGADFDLHLSGPFGVNPVRMTGNLQTDETVLHDGTQSIEGEIGPVMRERLGFALPLPELANLVRGIPASDVGEVTLDEESRAARILQGEWEIEYRDYRCCEEPALPGRVRFARGAMRGVLVVREWSRD